MSSTDRSKANEQRDFSVTLLQSSAAVTHEHLTMHVKCLAYVLSRARDHETQGLS